MDVMSKWSKVLIQNSIFFLFFILYSLPGWSASHHPQEFLKSIVGKKNEGEQIVQHYCANCHAAKPIIQLGAPRIGYRQDWVNRVKPGLDTLFKHTDEGFNAMPARGGCFECSDKQLLLAIYALLPNNKKSHKKQLKAIK